MTTGSGYFAPLGGLKTLGAKAGNRRPVLAVAQLTRPGNTNAYAAGDAIMPATAGTTKALKFGPIASGTDVDQQILSAVLIDMAHQTTALDLDLLLFSADLAVLPTDNDPFAPSAADMANYLGVIKFVGSDADSLGAYRTYQVVPNLIVSTAVNGKDVYGLPIARNAYTPVALEKLVFKLGFTPKDFALL